MDTNKRVDPDQTVKAVCENCGGEAEYHSEFILCQTCETRLFDCGDREGTTANPRRD